MRSRVDRDGLRISDSPDRRKRVWIFVGSVIALALGLAVAWRGGEDVAAVAHATPAPSPPAAAPSGPAAPRAVPVRRAQDEADAARSADAPPEPVASEPDAEPDSEPDFTLPIPGAEPTGIALFPKPGTDPPKVGILVPDDFELPPGFIRHHQATDDGQELAPILMFHPDFDFVDANGDPIELPESRVVPPELAPTGLEIELLELPEPLPDDAP